MSAPPPASDPWLDAEGNHIRIQSRVEQVAKDPDRGALPSRLHQRGQVIGRGTGGLIYVRFDYKNQLIALRPHLVRVIEEPGDY